MNIKAIAERIGMDYENVMEDYCGDVAAVKERLLRFPSDTDLSALEGCVSSGDMDGIRREAHRIRKCAKKLGLGSLAGIASHLEETGEGLDMLRTTRDSICSVIGEAE